MLRKSFMMVVAFVLAIVLPLAALADVQYTFSVVPGDMLASEQVIADLCETFAFRLTKGESSGAVTLLMNDKPMGTIGLSADDTGLYAASADLVDGVLYVSWDDLFALVADGMMAVYEEAGMDEAALQTMKTSMENAKVGVAASFAQKETAQPFSAAAMEEGKQIVAEMFPDDPGMTAYITGLYDGVVIEEGKFSSDIHDTADSKMTLTMDAQDVSALFDTEYMRSILTEALAASGEEMTEAEADKAVEELLVQAKKLYEESNLTMTMEAYTADEGEKLISLDMDMLMNVDTQLEGEPVKVNMEMKADYNRLTSSKGISHKAAGSIAVDEEAIVTEFELFKASNGVSDGMLGMLADGEEVVITYHGEPAPGKKRVRQADIYVRSGATAILEPAAADRPIIGFKVISEPAPAEVLEALENASAQNSVNVFKMSETEMQNMLMEMLNKGAQIYYNILGEMPTSVLNLLSESGMIQ